MAHKCHIASTISISTPLSLFARLLLWIRASSRKSSSDQKRESRHPRGIRKHLGVLLLLLWQLCHHFEVSNGPSNAKELWQLLQRVGRFQGYPGEAQGWEWMNTCQSCELIVECQHHWVRQRVANPSLKLRDCCAEERRIFSLCEQHDEWTKFSMFSTQDQDRPLCKLDTFFFWVVRFWESFCLPGTKSGPATTNPWFAQEGLPNHVYVGRWTFIFRRRRSNTFAFARSWKIRHFTWRWREPMSFCQRNSLMRRIPQMKPASEWRTVRRTPYRLQSLTTETYWNRGWYQCGRSLQKTPQIIPKKAQTNKHPNPYIAGDHGRSRSTPFSTWMSLLARNHGKARLLRFLLTCSWPEMHVDIENSFLIGCWYLFWAATSNLKRFILGLDHWRFPPKNIFASTGSGVHSAIFVPVWLHSGHAASDCKEWRLAHPMAYQGKRSLKTVKTTGVCPHFYPLEFFVFSLSVTFFATRFLSLHSSRVCLWSGWGGWRWRGGLVFCQVFLQTIFAPGGWSQEGRTLHGSGGLMIL